MRWRTVNRSGSHTHRQTDGPSGGTLNPVGQRVLTSTAVLKGGTKVPLSTPSVIYSLIIRLPIRLLYYRYYTTTHERDYPFTSRFKSVNGVKKERTEREYKELQRACVILIITHNNITHSHNTLYAHFNPSLLHYVSR